MRLAPEIAALLQVQVANVDIIKKANSQQKPLQQIYTLKRRLVLKLVKNKTMITKVRVKAPVKH